MTAHRCAGGLKKKLNLRSGSKRHRHFVGFFNVPVQAPTRDPPFYGYSEKPPHFSRLSRHAWGYGGHILDLTPRVPTGEKLFKELYNSHLTYCCRVIWQLWIKWYVHWCFTSHATVFQSYMWRHRCAGGLKKLYLRSGSQSHRHFVGFLNVSVLHRHGATLFIRLFRRNHPIQSPLTTRCLGIRRTYSHLNPPPPRGLLYTSIQYLFPKYYHKILNNIRCCVREIVSDISVTGAGGLKKSLHLQSGSHRHRHFIGFFNASVKAPTRDQPFYSYSKKPSYFSRLLRRAWG